MNFIIGALQSLGVKFKQGSLDLTEVLRLRIGGFDRRKEMFKGWIEIEKFVYQGNEGSFCVMQRDQV